MKRNDSFINLVKYKTLSAFRNNSFYIASITLNLICSVYFFIMRNFFGGEGSTDLKSLFECISLVSSFEIPLIVCSTYSKDDFLFPFSEKEILFSNLFASIFQTLIILLTVLFIPLSVSFFGDIETNQLFTGFACVLLFFISCISFCLFLCFVFDSKLISFFTAAILLFISNILHTFSSIFVSKNILSKIIKFISFSWHFNSSKKGILDSRDLIFFLLVSFLFIYFAIQLKKLLNGKIFQKKEKTTNLLIILISIFVFLDSGKYFKRIDLTENKKYSVSNYTKSLLNEVKDFTTITYYRSSFLDNLYPQVKEISDFLFEYGENKKIIIKIEDPEKSGKAETLKLRGIESKQFQTTGKNRTEYVDVYSAIVIEYKQNWKTIPFLLSIENLEYQLDIKLVELLYEKNRYVNILCGNNKSLKEDYSLIIPWLNSQGFICNEIDNTRNISEQIQQCRKYGNLLLIFGSNCLSDEDCLEIENYLESGGRILFCISPYEIDIDTSWNITKPKNQKLIKMIDAFGITLDSSIVSDLSCARILMESENDSYGNPQSKISRQINYPYWIDFQKQVNAPQGLLQFWPVSISFADDNKACSPLIYSSSYSQKTQPSTEDSASLFVTNPFLCENMKFEKENLTSSCCAVSYNGDIYGFYNAGVFNNINFEIIPDQYFVNTLMLSYAGGEYGDYRNLEYISNRLLILNDELELSKLQNKEIHNNFIFSKIFDDETFLKAKKKAIALNFISVPLIYILIGFVNLIIRKKRSSHEK